MRKTATRCVLTLLLPMASGCYVSRPATLASIAPGQEFHIVLSDAGWEHLTSVSAETGRELSGRLQRLTQDSVTLTTRLRGPAYVGQTFGDLRQPFTFARADIAQVTVPELNRGRTAAVVAAATVVGVTVIAAIIRFAGVGDEESTPPDPTAPFFGR